MLRPAGRRQEGFVVAEPEVTHLHSQWRSQSPVATFQLAARFPREGLSSTRRIRLLTYRFHSGAPCSEPPA